MKNISVINVKLDFFSLPENWVQLSALIFVALAYSGCTIDSGVNGAGAKSVARGNGHSVIAPVRSGEFVSSVNSGTRTASGYLTSGSIGSQVRTLNGTTASGYKFYLTGQGQVHSGEVH